VFTSRRFAGNRLAVVHEADRVPDRAMQAFARETGLSETSFLQAPRRVGADYRHRIWMVRHEIPFAGHPSLGAAVAHVRATGRASATVVQQTGAGLQPVEVELAGDRARSSMLQEPMVLGPALDPAEVTSLVGLGEDDLEPALSPRVVGTGVPQLLVVVRDRGAVERCAAPPAADLASLVDRHGAVVLYVAAVVGERAHARSFFPGGEDPATGSAAGPLLAYVREHTAIGRLEIAQGVEMGRPARLEAHMDGDRVRVGGDSVVVLEGRVRLDG
jgi:trans-2,3-dihydro-3-hydroxyanthranilate isomerase